MPYWSSSRVGAVPVGGNGNSKSSNPRRSMRRGITMEDLKKQTALRLAQEQGGIPGETVTTTPTKTPPSRGHRFRSSKTPVASSEASSFASPASLENVGFPGSPMTEMTPNRGVVPEEQGYVVASHPLRSHTPSNNTSTMMMYNSNTIDSATEKGANSKLPHGLTVHELKEMTKARLEAEAVRGHGDPSSSNRLDAYASPAYPSRRSPYPPTLDNTTEAWESASVSTAASDYPDYHSLSFHGSGGGNHSFHTVDEDSFIPLTRVPSNHPPPMQQNLSMRVSDWSQGENYPPPQGMLYATDAVPNRRRAATMSPRLSQNAVPAHSSSFHIPHTEEEFHYGVRTTAPMYPPPPLMNHGGGTAFEANRARTASLPTILSPTSHDNDFHTSSSRLLFEAPSAFRDPPPPAVAGLSDVFAKAPSLLLDDVVLPGFHDSQTTNRLRASSMLDEALAGFDVSSAAPSRGRAASDFLAQPRHWTDAASLFCGAALSDDLASILKLTTTTDKPPASTSSPPL